MEQPIESQENVQDNFKKGPDGNGPQQDIPQGPSKEQKKAILKEYQDELPLLRAQVEYERLQMELLQIHAESGRRPINTIPGLLGAELMVREVQALGYLASWRNEIDQRQKDEQAAREARENAQKETPATDEGGNDTTVKQ